MRQSRQLNISLPLSMVEDLKKLARDESRTISNMIQFIIQEAIKKQNKNLKGNIK